MEEDQIIECEILVDSLQEICPIFQNNPWIGTNVTQDMVLQALANNDLQSSHYDPVSSDWTSSQHAARIAYLVQHPSMEPIHLNFEPDYRSFTDWPIEDGNHRLAAAIVLGWETINTCIRGDLEVASQALSQDLSDL